MNYIWRREWPNAQAVEPLFPNMDGKLPGGGEKKGVGRKKAWDQETMLLQLEKQSASQQFLERG